MDPTQQYSEQIAALRQRDPRFNQMMGETRGWGPFRSNSDELLRYLQQQGITLPENMHLNRAGVVDEGIGLGEFLLKGGLMTGGAMLGMGALNGAIGPGLAGAGSGGSVPPHLGGGDVAGQTASGFDLGGLAKLGLGGAAVIGGLTGNQGQMPPQAQELLDLQKRRLEASNPLYESVLRLAFSRMPTGATQGLPTPQVK